MQKFSLMLDSQGDVKQALEKVWHTLRVRGEVAVIPMDGKFRVDVISESDLTPLEVSQLPGKSV